MHHIFRGMAFPHGTRHGRDPRPSISTTGFPEAPAGRKLPWSSDLPRGLCKRDIVRFLNDLVPRKVH